MVYSSSSFLLLHSRPHLVVELCLAHESVSQFNLLISPPNPRFTPHLPYYSCSQLENSTVSTTISHRDVVGALLAASQAALVTVYHEGGRHAQV